VEIFSLVLGKVFFFVHLHAWATQTLLNIL